MLEASQLRKDAVEARETAVTIHDVKLRGTLLAAAVVYEDMARKLEAAAPAQPHRRGKKPVRSIA